LYIIDEVRNIDLLNTYDSANTLFDINNNQLCDSSTFQLKNNGILVDNNDKNIQLFNQKKIDLNNNNKFPCNNNSNNNINNNYNNNDISANDNNENGNNKLKINSSSYDLIPNDIIKKLNIKNNWKIRTQAIDSLQNYINNISDAAILINNLEYYFNILYELINDINFKISLNSLIIIKHLIYKSGLYIQIHLDNLIPLLIHKLNDKKQIIQQKIVEIFLLLSVIISPKLVIKFILKSNITQAYEQKVKLILCILKESPNSDYDFNELITYLIPLVESNDEKVAVSTYEILNKIATISPFYSQKVINILSHSENFDNTMNVININKKFTNINENIIKNTYYNNDKESINENINNIYNNNQNNNIAPSFNGSISEYSINNKYVYNNNIYNNNNNNSLYYPLR